MEKQTRFGARRRGMEVIVVLVRHGETTWNSIKRLQGQQDTDLTDLGEQQAELTGAFLRNKFPNGFDLVVSSDLKRAVDTTLKIVQAEDQRAKIVKDARLREIALGVFEKSSVQEIVCDPERKDLWANFCKDPFYKAPGGESHQDQRERAGECLDEHVRSLMDSMSTDISVKKKVATLLIVCHGGTLACLHRHVNEQDNFVHTPRAGNCSVSLLKNKMNFETMKSEWVQQKWNDQTHLKSFQSNNKTL